MIRQIALAHPVLHGHRVLVVRNLKQKGRQTQYLCVLMEDTSGGWRKGDYIWFYESELG